MRILSGMQPTGRLHLGNYEGALRNWVELQDHHEMFCCIVDWHALTTQYEDPGQIAASARQVAIDYLAAGLDPERCAIFIQSHVKEHAELYLLFSMVTPLGWLERVPTYKEKRDQLGNDDSIPFGLLGYPVLQSADILVYKAEGVPVGKDQLPHLELARETARRFNHLYRELFPEPQALLREGVEVLPGLDGRKMSKSYGNTIYMADSPDEIRRKVRSMITDPEKIRMGDPGHPEICPVYAYQRVYQPEKADEVAAGCRAGTLGCVADKKDLAEAIIRAMAPVHERRRELEARPDYIEDVLRDGACRARAVAGQTMEEVRAAMGIY